MARPVTLFTGQWADLPLEEVAQKASEWGFQGLELACWGDHFEVPRAIDEDDYCQRKIDLLISHFGSQGSKQWFDAETFLGLARLRGMECRASERYAEAFFAHKLTLI